MAVDEIIARIEAELPDWLWHVEKGPGFYRATLRAGADSRDGPEVHARGATAGGALVTALDDAKAGRFSYNN